MHRTIAFVIGVLLFLTITGCEGNGGVEPVEVSQVEEAQEDIVADEYADVYLSELTTSSITFTVEIENDELSQDQIEYTISGEGYSKVEVLEDQSRSIIKIDDLEQDTVYTLEISKIDSKTVLDIIVFRTFKEINNGCQLYYLIDAKKPHDHTLNVQIFGNMKKMNMISFDNRGYHFDNSIDIVENSLEVNTEDYHSDEKNREVIIYNNSEHTYFEISYQVDKSVIDMQWNEYLGFLDSDYLMTTGEMLMILPKGDLDQLILDYNTFEMYGYLKHPQHWELVVGFEVEDNLINFLSHLPYRKDEGVRAANIYAYNENVFKKTTENIDGTNISVILQDTINDSYFKDILSVYTMLPEIWGSGVGDDNYTVMIVDDDQRRIYAGEWTTGQGFSTYYKILDEMLVHQMYHRWNGWERGIGFPNEQSFIDNPGDWVRGFWSEGFNNFYADKVLTELGFMDHDLMKEYYFYYKSIRGTSSDVPILEFRRGVDDFEIVYGKGALLAYLLDQEIRSESNNNYSLDDVLKYEWERWRVDRKYSSYEIIIDYIRDELGVDTIDSWWDKYIIDNEPMYMDDFPFLEPVTSINIAATDPANGEENVSVDTDIYIIFDQDGSVI